MTLTQGQAVKQAVRFLEETFNDVSKLIETLDGLMSERGWRPTEPNRISDDLGNGLRSGHWVLNDLWRLYVPQADDFQSRRLLALQISFMPAAFEEAICLAVAATFSESRNWKAIWEKWTDSSDVLAHLARHPGPQCLDKERLHGSFLPDAERGLAFSVPLCTLDGTESLLARLVEPAIAAEQELAGVATAR